MKMDISTNIIALVSLFTSVRIFSRFLGTSDFNKELISNHQLAASDENTKSKMKEDLINKTIERGILLRKKSIQSFALLLFASISAIIILLILRKLDISALSDLLNRSRYQILSVFFFGFGTLGRIGWKGQSYNGNTVYERADNCILWGSYFLGMFFSIIALI